MDLPEKFGIYIATHKGDLKYCLGTIQSIRDSIAPDVPLTLLIDGNFTLPSYIKATGVGSIFTSQVPSPLKKEHFTGWGYSKLLPFFYGPYETFMVIDADCIVIGNVLKHIDVTKDFFSSKYRPDYQLSDANIEEAFFNIETMEKIVGPGWRQYKDLFFISGVFYAKKGVITYEEYVQAMATKKDNGDFLFPGDQGLLNYILLTKQMNGQVAWGNKFFQFIGLFFQDEPQLAGDYNEHIKRYRVPNRVQYPLVIHWAGNAKPYFLNFYYKPAPMTHYRIRYLTIAGYTNFGAIMTIIKQDIGDTLKLLYYVIKVKILRLK